MRRRPVSAVFFDVDFTLIYPGPTFQGEGYAAFCERYGMTVDPATAAGSSTYQGATYYFCSLHCKTKFDPNPEAWVRGGGTPPDQPPGRRRSSATG